MKISELTYKDFIKIYKEGHKTIPVYKKVVADMLTPVSAWVSLYEKSNHCFLFESVEKGTRFSRFSYIGIDPSKLFKFENNKTVIVSDNNSTISDKPFLSLIEEAQKKHKSARVPGLPSFTGGLVGYLSYEAVAWFEDIPIHVQESNKFPESIFMLFNEVIAFDHYDGHAFIICNANVENKASMNKTFNECHEKIDELGELLHSRINHQTPAEKSINKLSSNFTKSDFKKMVKKAKEHIVNGEVFQLVISQKFYKKTNASSTTIYRALRRVNPSPYLFHIKIGKLDIIGSSPELLVKVEDEEMEVRPIAGTRHRGSSQQEDIKLAEDLLNDQKELAEHLMLIDLARNDVGKVSEYGSVKVTEKMVVEYFSHVMHIVSNVKGNLKKNKTAFDALASGFPAGTVTGAPKIRSMELIYELERERRNIYSGAIGFFDFFGNINSCIAIRTIIKNDVIVEFQVGAGIVYDSVPENEYKETISKAQAMIRALELAENGLVQ